MGWQKDVRQKMNVYITRLCWAAGYDRWLFASDK